MTRFADMFAEEAGRCDWCGHVIELGQPITQLRRDITDADRVPRDPRWFHARCARQFAVDAFW